MSSRNFCTTSELAADLGDANVGVIDASWHLPITGRIGAAEFLLAHIPGAVFLRHRHDRGSQGRPAAHAART